MHSEMLHMLLYKKDLGRPIKTVLSFYNLRFFFICSSIHVVHIKIQLYRLHNRFNGNTSN